MPYIPRLVRTHGEQVYITGGSLQDISVWTFGESVRPLDVSNPIRDLTRIAKAHRDTLEGLYHPPRHWLDHIDFLFHPILENVVFLVLHHPFGFSIYEYIDGSQSRSFHLDSDALPESSPMTIVPRAFWETKGLNCQPANAHGRYSLLTVDPYECAHNRTACQCSRYLLCSTNVVFFDVIQAKFSIDFYPCSP